METKFMDSVAMATCHQIAQEKNVVAICDVNKSTKQLAEKKFIGAKGIGFKSVSPLHLLGHYWILLV